MPRPKSGKLLNLICPYCGKEFKRYLSAAENRNSVCCCGLHSGKYRKLKKAS